MKNQLPGSFIATKNLKNATTAYHKEPFPALFAMCNGAMQNNNRTFMLENRLIRTNLNWIRDYVLSMKGFRYFEQDITSFPDLILEEQTPEGFFYEIIAPLTDCHGCGMGIPGKSFPESGYGLTRLELEADIEYLMVEGVYLIWQSIGDDDYLRKNLPRLEKGLRYIMTDPKRWDSTCGLAKRPRTIDTWDFLNRDSSSLDRSIHPDDPMGIMHGDNTGLYQAHVLMAKMYRVIGDGAAAERHDSLGKSLKERINQSLWNGKFYKHFLRLDDTDYGVDETWQLSLSNAYDLNRGTADHAMCLSIINAYKSMREKYKGEFDDFRTLDPAYPSFKGMKAGTYVNGTCGPFIAGELALAAFEHGMEDYGVDILYRIGCKMSRDGKIAFNYNYDGTDVGGGPRCWCGAEILNAMSRGLAGVVDNGKLFENVTLSPRWVAAREPEAHVRLEYAASRANVEYHFRHDAAKRTITVDLLSRHSQLKLRILLPPEAETPHCAKPFAIRQIEQSRYLVIDGLSDPETITISY